MTDTFLSKLRRKSGKRTTPASKAFYDRAAWRKMRIYFLNEHPICADPFGVHATEGEVIAANEVDHVIPRSQRPDLELDEDNLQALCKRCHSRKTLTDMRRKKRKVTSCAGQS